MHDGVRFWDLESRNNIAFLPIGTTLAVGFARDGAELFTCGPVGFQRWAIHRDDPASDKVRLGPPKRYSLDSTSSRVAENEQPARAAVISEPGGKAVLLNTDSAISTPPIPEHESGRY